ncbi:MAG: HAD family hydrolase [Acidimicrobiales bacterium]
MSPSHVPLNADLVVFDLDGTLIDSDDALAAAFVTLGIERSAITYGHVIADECDRLGLSLDAYLDAYDTDVAPTYPGVEEMLAQIPRWAVCSNKHPRSARAELQRLGWTPEVALFADAFDGPKRVEPVLVAGGVTPERAVFVGDTNHDRAAAADAGCRFVWAGWNPRVRPRADDEVATSPAELVAMLGCQSSSG